MGRLVEWILQLSGTPAYALVGVLAFAEAAAFVGLFVPGEVAVLLGGVVASTGGASLSVMVTVAALAAIVGDSVGYEVGRRFGQRLLDSPRIQQRMGSKLQTAADYVRRRGGRAVFPRAAFSGVVGGAALGVLLAVLLEFVGRAVAPAADDRDGTKVAT